MTGQPQEQPQQAAEVVVVQQPVDGGKGKNWINYVASLLISLGVVGGGGTIGVNVIQNDLEHQGKNLTEVVENVKEVQKRVTSLAPVIQQVERLQLVVDKFDEKLDSFAPKQWVIKLQEKVSELSEQVIRLEGKIEKLRRQ